MDRFFERDPGSLTSLNESHTRITYNEWQSIDGPHSQIMQSLIEQITGITIDLSANDLISFSQLRVLLDLSVMLRLRGDRCSLFVSHHDEHQCNA